MGATMKARGLVMTAAAGLLVMLAGCVTDGDSRGSRHGSRYYYDDDDEPRRMSGRAMAALAEGCKQRFYPGTSKFKECLRGERKSDDSLVEGCTRLYKNDPKNYGRCLQGR